MRMRAAAQRASYVLEKVPYAAQAVAAARAHSRKAPSASGAPRSAHCARAAVRGMRVAQGDALPRDMRIRVAYAVRVRVARAYAWIADTGARRENTDLIERVMLRPVSPSRIDFRLLHASHAR